MKFIRQYNKCIFLIAFPIIAWLLVNSTINRHSHIVQGYVFSHAHPYQKDTESKTPFKTHKHTEDELILFDRISNFLIILTTILFVSIFLQLIKEIRIVQPNALPVPVLFSIQKYRAPPSFI